MRTGKVDFGQSTAHTAYKQIVAEELSVPYEAITTVVMGDTDRTPDGGFSAGFLEYGGQNLRKAAAYTYQAILDLAATTLGVDKSQLTVKDGVITGGGKRLTYGELVRGQELKLTIPVEGDLTTMFGLTVAGNPPMKPTARLHHHRQVVREHRHAGQGDGPGAVGHQRPPAQHAARPRRAPEDARVDARRRPARSTRRSSRTRRSS